MTDVFLVTQKNYPSVFKAFELISHDCGRQAGHTNYAVPLKWDKTIETIEYDLTRLLVGADSDFECLCTGDMGESAKIVKDYKLEVADQLLQEFFEEFS